MTPSLPVTIAPNFHLPGTAAERVLVPGPEGWRAVTESELSAASGDSLLLFVLPVHLHSSFWAMLERAETDRDFPAFAAEFGRFLTFKRLPPPEQAVFELVLHRSGGAIESHGLWVIVNMGDETVVVGVSEMRVCLRAGEGVRLAEFATLEIVAPIGDHADVLLLVRRKADTPCH